MTIYQPVGIFDQPHGMSTAAYHPDSRTRLLDAALRIVREKGYTAATVDDICTAADLTKGSFFHHFKSKEDLAIAAADHFAAMAEALFASASYRRAADPLDRVLGYIEFRRSILRGDLARCTCLLGTMVQEVYETHPAIRAACERHMSAHASSVTRDIAQAKAAYCPAASWSAESLGLHTQAVLQGAMVLAKASGSPAAAIECVDHLARYVELLFSPISSSPPTPGTSPGASLAKEPKEPRR